MTAPDPLPTVTDSATAFEDRLTFFEQDGTAHAAEHTGPDTWLNFIDYEPTPQATTMLIPVVEEIHPPFRQRLTITTPERGLDLHAAFRAGFDPMAARVTETLRCMAEQQALTAPEPDAHRLAARVAHGYEDQEARS